MDVFSLVQRFVESDGSDMNELNKILEEYKKDTNAFIREIICILDRKDLPQNYIQYVLIFGFSCFHKYGSIRYINSTYQSELILDLAKKLFLLMHNFSDNILHSFFGRVLALMTNELEEKMLYISELYKVDDPYRLLCYMDVIKEMILNSPDYNLNFFDIIPSSIFTCKISNTIRVLLCLVDSLFKRDIKCCSEQFASTFLDNINSFLDSFLNESLIILKHIFSRFDHVIQNSSRLIDRIVGIMLSNIQTDTAINISKLINKVFLSLNMGESVSRILYENKELIIQFVFNHTVDEKSLYCFNKTMIYIIREFNEIEMFSIVVKLFDIYNHDHKYILCLNSFKALWKHLSEECMSDAMSFFQTQLQSISFGDAQNIKFEIFYDIIDKVFSMNNQSLIAQLYTIYNDLTIYFRSDSIINKRFFIKCTVLFVKQPYFFKNTEMIQLIFDYTSQYGGIFESYSFYFLKEIMFILSKEDASDLFSSLIKLYTSQDPSLQQYIIAPIFEYIFLYTNESRNMLDELTQIFVNETNKGYDNGSFCALAFFIKIYGKDFPFFEQMVDVAVSFVREVHIPTDIFNGSLLLNQISKYYDVGDSTLDLLYNIVQDINLLPETQGMILDTIINISKAKKIDEKFIYTFNNIYTNLDSFLEEKTIRNSTMIVSSLLSAYRRLMKYDDLYTEINMNILTRLCRLDYLFASTMCGMLKTLYFIGIKNINDARIVIADSPKMMSILEKCLNEKKLSDIASKVRSLNL